VKISLLGISNCGKTSIYNVAFTEKRAIECENLAPTVSYEIHSHPFLGIELGLFDFGGQKDHRMEYLERPELFVGTDVLIFIVDLHDRDSYNAAKEYFQDILNVFRESIEKPKVYLFLHKCDTKNYQADLLGTNIEDAKSHFFELFDDFNFNFEFTSIYEHEKLAMIIRNMLFSFFEELRGHVIRTDKQLKEINAIIIITDISGNILSHNYHGIDSGFVLRGELREFLEASNKVRENIFLSESLTFNAKKGEKELNLYIIKYILCVLVLKSKELDKHSQQKLSILLNDMKLFANLILTASNTSN